MKWRKKSELVYTTNPPAECKELIEEQKKLEKKITISEPIPRKGKAKAAYDATKKLNMLFF